MNQQHRKNISRGLRYYHAKKRLIKKLRLVIRSLQIFTFMLLIAFTIQAFEELAHINSVEYVQAWEKPQIYEVMEGNEYALLMANIAERYEVDYDLMQYIVWCESRFDSDIQSHYYQDYGREESFGLSQIHLRAHPHITVEQATDPVFALEFLAEHIKSDDVDHMWVNCYKEYQQQ